MYGVIYKITNTVNSKEYYGQTRQPPRRRWSQHRQNAKKGNKGVLYDAMRKYGLDSFSFEIICECSTLEELNAAEIKYICEGDTLVPNGYNASKGGDNYEKTPETCKKLSESNKARVITPEWRENMSKAKKGCKITEETRQKMSEAQQGRVVKEETKEKLRQINLGKKQSAETLERKRQSRLGVPWSEKKRKSMEGKKHTEESKQKMSASQKGRIFSEETKQKMKEAKKSMRKLTDEHIQEIVLNKDGLTHRELANKFNVSRSLIDRVIKTHSISTT